MKLHIGCGKRNLPGWKHFDIRKIDAHIDFVGKADDLSQFADDSIEEIYACHLLEHFGRHEVDKVLVEWNRVLVKSGVIHIAVPDFEAVMEYYSEEHNLQKILGFLYGGQDYAYNYHYMAFDYKYLKERLEAAGFEKIERYEWRDFLPEGYDDYSRSYQPHMDFEHGKLMSLNVAAMKK